MLTSKAVSLVFEGEMNVVCVVGRTCIDVFVTHACVLNRCHFSCIRVVLLGAQHSAAGCIVSGLWSEYVCILFKTCSLLHDHAAAHMHFTCGAWSCCLACLCAVLLLCVHVLHNQLLVQPHTCCGVTSSVHCTTPTQVLVQMRLCSCCCATPSCCTMWWAEHCKLLVSAWQELCACAAKHHVGLTATGQNCH